MRLMQLDIEIESADWRKIKGLKKGLAAAQDALVLVLPPTLQKAAQRAQATLLLTSGKRIRALNKDWRGIDKATNVLSFPHYARRDMPALGDFYLGDIAVAFEVVVKESKEESKRPLDHVTHLFIHGLLHLWGYDHDTHAKAARMEKMERQIMKELDLPDPYGQQS